MEALLQQECLNESQLTTYRSQVSTASCSRAIVHECLCQLDVVERQLKVGVSESDAADLEQLRDNLTQLISLTEGPTVCARVLCCTVECVCVMAGCILQMLCLTSRNRDYYSVYRQSGENLTVENSQVEKGRELKRRGETKRAETVRTRATICKE